MERSVAIKKLGRLLGKNMGYRVDDKAPTGEARAAAKDELQSANVSRNKLSTECEARREAILAADPEYQRLLAEWKVAREHAAKLLGIVGWYKITVGKTNGMFFTVEAEGDSWEDVIAKIEKRSGFR